jgi:hypothetical protein
MKGEIRFLLNSRREKKEEPISFWESVLYVLCGMAIAAALGNIGYQIVHLVKHYN